MRMRSLPPVSLRASTTDSRQWSARTWADKSARIQSRRSCSRYANRQRGSDPETDEDFGWRQPPDFKRRAPSANDRILGIGGPGIRGDVNYLGYRHSVAITHTLSQKLPNLREKLTRAVRLRYEIIAAGRSGFLFISAQGVRRDRDNWYRA